LNDDEVATLVSNPCMVFNGGCSDNATCIVVSPTVKRCVCNQGYKGNGVGVNGCTFSGSPPFGVDIVWNFRDFATQNYNNNHKYQLMSHGTQSVNLATPPSCQTLYADKASLCVHQLDSTAFSDAANATAEWSSNALSGLNDTTIFARAALPVVDRFYLAVLPGVYSWYIDWAQAPGNSPMWTAFQFGGCLIQQQLVLMYADATAGTDVLWHALAVTFRPRDGLVRLWIDGFVVASATCASPPSLSSYPPTTTPFVMYHTPPLLGLAVWSRILSDSEIQAISADSCALWLGGCSDVASCYALTPSTKRCDCNPGYFGVAYRGSNLTFGVGLTGCSNLLVGSSSSSTGGFVTGGGIRTDSQAAFGISAVAGVSVAVIVVSCALLVMLWLAYQRRRQTKEGSGKDGEVNMTEVPSTGDVTTAPPRVSAEAAALTELGETDTNNASRDDDDSAVEGHVSDRVSNGSPSLTTPGSPEGVEYTLVSVNAVP